MKLQFDLRWHLGNVFSLLIIARRVGRQRGMSDQAIRSMLDDMKGGDYNHLLKALERWLPETFHFLGDPRGRQSRRRRTKIDESVPPLLADLLNADGVVAEIHSMAVAGLLAWPDRSSR